jgi:hypothetical protein
MRPALGLATMSAPRLRETASMRKLRGGTNPLAPFSLMMADAFCQQSTPMWHSPSMHTGTSTNICCKTFRCKLQSHARAHECTHSRTHTHTNTNTNTHTHIYIYIYVCVWVYHCYGGNRRSLFSASCACTRKDNSCVLC